MIRIFILTFFLGVTYSFSQNITNEKIKFEDDFGIIHNVELRTFYKSDQKDYKDSVQVKINNEWVTYEICGYDSTYTSSYNFYGLLDTINHIFQYVHWEVDRENLETEILKRKKLDVILPTVSEESFELCPISSNYRFACLKLENTLQLDIIDLKTRQIIKRFNDYEASLLNKSPEVSNTGRYAISNYFVIDFLTDISEAEPIDFMYTDDTDGNKRARPIAFSQNDDLVYACGETYGSHQNLIMGFDVTTQQLKWTYTIDDSLIAKVIRFDECNLSDPNHLVFTSTVGSWEFDLTTKKATVLFYKPDREVQHQSGNFLLSYETFGSKGKKKFYLKNTKTETEVRLKLPKEFDNGSRAASYLMVKDNKCFLLVSLSDKYTKKIKVFEINTKKGTLSQIGEIKNKRLLYHHFNLYFPACISNEINIPVVDDNRNLSFLSLNSKMRTVKQYIGNQIFSPKVMHRSRATRSKLLLWLERTAETNSYESNQELIGIDLSSLNRYYKYNTEQKLQTILRDSAKDWFETNSLLVEMEDVFYNRSDYFQPKNNQARALYHYLMPLLSTEPNTGLVDEERIIDFSDNKIIYRSYLGLGHVNLMNESPLKNVVYILFNAAGNHLFLSSDNYYAVSDGFKSDLSFSYKLKSFPFEQFDLKYNRPDIILNRLGYADSALVKAYHSAYLKRLKKMGFTEDMLKDDFHLPEIEIENFEELPRLYDQGSIDLKLKLDDSKYKLDRINLWVNDVAVYGAEGISLRDKNTQTYTTNLSVDLARGNNKIQVSVLNQAGAESYKETVEIKCVTGKSKPNLYLITIGVSEFEQSDFNLTYAAKDANDIATLFQKSYVYKKIFSKTLVNKEVTKANVMALKTFLAQADINDEVMIFIAGHGVLDANLDYYFATYDLDFRRPENKGLAYEDLEGLLDGIKPLKKTLIIDACHSGEIDKDEVELVEADIAEDDNIQFRVVGNIVEGQLGIQNTSELTKSLFTDLRKGTGATVISSAGGMEFAMEGDDWSNGLFTYCLINGIKTKAADLNGDKEIWLSEIQEYVSLQVSELSGGRQQPTSRIENQTVDFRVW